VSSARKIRLGIANLSPWKPSRGLRIKPMDDIVTQYFIRLSAADRTGVLAQIATVFGNNDISISSAIQPESDSENQTAEIVIMTHPALEKAMMKALDELKQLEVVKEIANCIRIEEIEGGYH
jgi:homoserine dehydrogenase